MAHAKTDGGPELGSGPLFFALKLLMQEF